MKISDEFSRCKVEMMGSTHSLTVWVLEETLCATKAAE